ncbi:ICOS ligand-like [Cebidichthys violaceus]|uniref:ICOS ligand-like n=1 Tax=Cebidichthys violaceus TaxID=271503 RepID=UPI0035CA13D6
MGLRSFSGLRRNGSLNGFCVFGAQTAHKAALWSSGLLLSFLGFCACLDEECILGIVGQPVSLPCIRPKLITSVNVTVEWRRGEEVVLRSVWRDDGIVEEWSINRATTPPKAALTGNLSLQLPTVNPSEHSVNYSLIVTSGQNQSAELCTVCLRTAASFSSPLLWREETGPGGETSFWCHSSGGFPAPALYWLINDTEDPPGGSVRTLAAALPNSLLYNVTSQLTLNVSEDASVSCVVGNPSINENLTATSSGVKVRGGPVVTGRASEAMWIFSTALCVVVGAMVLVGVVYQIHLDRMSKRKKKDFQKQHPMRGYKRRRPEEEEEEEEKEAMKPEKKETDV